MKYLILDLSTGEKLFSTIDRNKAIVFLNSIKSIRKVNCFIAKSDGKILAKVA